MRERKLPPDLENLDRDALRALAEIDPVTHAMLHGLPPERPYSYYRARLEAESRRSMAHICREAIAKLKAMPDEGDQA